MVKLDITKIKNFCYVKETIKRIKREATINGKDTSVKDRYPQYTKKLLKPNNKKMTELKMGQIPSQILCQRYTDAK